MRSLVHTSPNPALLLAPPLVCFLLFSCEPLGQGPRLNDEITTFVGAEPLPKVQRPRIVFDSDTLNAQVFWVSFGEARDCPSGCFYSKAYGILFRGRIGWMGLDAYGRDDSVQTEVSYFDPHPGDSLLYGTDIRARFRRVEESTDNSYVGGAYDAFLEMLAKEEDTPPRNTPCARSAS